MSAARSCCATELLPLARVADAVGRGADPRAEWIKTSIDPGSSGFEHAAILEDDDGSCPDSVLRFKKMPAAGGPDR